MTEKNYYETNDSFDIIEYCTAKQVYSAWQAEQAQELDEYLLRQRKAELNALVKKVVDTELNEMSKQLIDMRWNKGYSLEKIAKSVGLDTSTVYRRLEKITEELYEKLKYALEYRFGKNQCKSAVVVKTQIKSGFANRSLSDCGARLRTIRKENLLPLADVSSCTGISEKRLEKIESGETQIKTSELISLAQFYKVTSDFLLFGKQRVLRDPFTGLPMTCKC